MLILEAPAKINLTLEVWANATTAITKSAAFIQTLSFCDSLQITPGKEVEFKGQYTGLVSEHSLVIKRLNH